jgi:hypothetical protein
MLTQYQESSMEKTITTFSRKILHHDGKISSIFFNIDWSLIFAVCMEFSTNFIFTIFFNFRLQMQRLPS